MEFDESRDSFDCILELAVSDIELQHIGCDAIYGKLSGYRSDGMPRSAFTKWMELRPMRDSDGRCGAALDVKLSYVLALLKASVQMFFEHHCELRRLHHSLVICPKRKTWFEPVFARGHSAPSIYEIEESNIEESDFISPIECYHARSPPRIR
jgi:hypothetical protein